MATFLSLTQFRKPTAFMVHRGGQEAQRYHLVRVALRPVPARWWLHFLLRVDVPQPARMLGISFVLTGAATAGSL